MREGSNANWPEIRKIAEEAGEKLSLGKKPGRETRTVYTRSYQKACALGYVGTETDWASFIRRHG